MILYSNIPTTIEGSQEKVIVSDWESQSFLNNILKEMKKMNLQMSFITDNTLNNIDIE